VSRTDISGKLLERLRREGLVPADQEVTVRRVNPSRAMRAEGAWSWHAEWGQARTEQTVGSQWPMSACVEAASWEVSRNQFGETSIDPKGKDGKYMSA
jgi:hypothetical protein